MFWRLLLIGIAAIAQAAVSGPSEFYVVAESFSDNGALFYHRVIEVKADRSDSIIRYIRVAPMNLFCPRMIVQAAQTRVLNMSPAQLVKANNPCAVKPGALRAALKEYAQTAGVFETVSFGIVAQCGSSPFILGLPIAEKVSLERMQQTQPDMVRLWNLASEIISRAFGSDEIFLDRTEDDNLIFQRAGEKLFPELISGRYDLGLKAAVRGNVGTWHSPSFRSLLERYRGPVSAVEVNAVPQLLNTQAYRFSHFIAPKYPPLAMQARIQGRVELQLSIAPATGEVLNVSAISGHPLLKPSAIEAARQWRFEPNSIGSESVNATLDFALHCE